MEGYFNFSDNDSLGHGLDVILNGGEHLDGLTLVIISYLGNKHDLDLDSVESIKIYNDGAVFIEKNGYREFLNLKNVLSVSLIGD